MPDALRQIKTLLGPSGIIDGAADMRPHLVSWRNGWEGKAPFIALPNDTQQVSEILAICHAHRIGVVPQGGNTGLVGGGIPSADGKQIVVNLSRLNKIRGFDKTGMAVTVEAGVILQNLQEEADRAGFLFPLSMASQGSAQIGGTVATNAGGTAVLRYGNMRNLVLGLEAVLPDGTVFSGLKNLPKDNAGYNVMETFIGSEGTLGIVTAATLRLFPRLSQNVTGFAAVRSPQAAMDMFAHLRENCGEHLGAFEIMSKATLELVVRHIPGARFPCRDDVPYYALVELGSAAAQIPLREMLEAALGEAMERGEALDAVIAENTAQAKQFWSLREHASEALRKEGAGAHFDISVPLAQLADFLVAMEARVLALAPGVILAPFGHAGDGNIHYNMVLPPGMNDAPRGELKKKLQDLIYGDVVRRGGSISAEHGIGLERKAELLRAKPPEMIALMKMLKKTFDPAGIMNPGKIFDA